MKISELIGILEQYPDDNYFNIAVNNVYCSYTITSTPEDLNCIATVEGAHLNSSNLVEGVNYGDALTEEATDESI